MIKSLTRSFKRFIKLISKDYPIKLGETTNPITNRNKNLNY